MSEPTTAAASAGVSTCAYFPQWPERAIRAGYRFSGGVRPLDGSRFGTMGPCGQMGPDDFPPPGFTRCGGIGLFVNGIPGATNVCISELFQGDVVQRNPLRKYESTSFRPDMEPVPGVAFPFMEQTAKTQGYLVLDHGSFALQDAIRAGIVDPTVLPITETALMRFKHMIGKSNPPVVTTTTTTPQSPTVSSGVSECASSACMDSLATPIPCRRTPSPGDWMLVGDIDHM